MGEDETWAEFLDILERRVWSESWGIPEDVWQEGVSRLLAELRAEGMDLHAPVPVVRQIDIAAVRF